MSSGVEPVFRLTLSDRALHRTARDSGPCYGGIARQIQPGGVVAIVREALGADFKPERFHRRPRHFVLPPRKAGEDNSCLGDHATLVIFRQAGRGFYLWIAAGRRASPAKIATLLRALDGMTVAGARLGLSRLLAQSGRKCAAFRHNLGTLGSLGAGSDTNVCSPQQEGTADQLRERRREAPAGASCAALCEQRGAHRAAAHGDRARSRRRR